MHKPLCVVVGNNPQIVFDFCSVFLYFYSKPSASDFMGIPNSSDSIVAPCCENRSLLGNRNAAQMSLLACPFPLLVGPGAWPLARQQGFLPRHLLAWLGVEESSQGVRARTDLFLRR